jgi:NAD(P)-dependent dehydrogenase (short-subunit alcohol dehydrogenase family)
MGNRLQDKVAIVTGAASGFGEGIAQRFATEGCAVIVNDLHRDSGERVAAAIRNAGGRAQFAYGDVSKGDDVQGLLDAALRHFGKLDIVINNAGTTHRNQPLLGVTEAEFDRVYAVKPGHGLFLGHSVFDLVVDYLAVIPYRFFNFALRQGFKPFPEKAQKFSSIHLYHPFFYSRAKSIK